MVVLFVHPHALKHGLTEDAMTPSTTNVLVELGLSRGDKK
jgi:hypothetical protein